MTTNDNDARITELTSPTRGSARIGTILTRPGELFLLVGPLPEVYLIGKIQHKNKRIGRKRLQATANVAQDILTKVYDMPPEVRGTQYADLVVWLKAGLGLN